MKVEIAVWGPEVAKGQLVIEPASGAKWVLTPFKTKVLLESAENAARIAREAIASVADRLVDGLAPFTAEDAAGLRSGEAGPKTWVRALRNYVDLGRSEGLATPHYSSLGALWSEQFRVGLSWQGYRLRIGSARLSAIVSPNRAYVLLPGEVLLAMTKDPSRANVLALLYNMVEADPGIPEALRVIS